MSIQKKNRRSVNVDSVQYIWYVAPDVDGPYDLLHIISEDKSIVLTVPLNMEEKYIISKGRLFQEKKASGQWERYRLPVKPGKEITPALVAEIIRWAVNGEEAETVNWDGNKFPV